MLVLSRKRGERICIGSHIELVVLNVRGSQVQLGLSAPCNVPIHRQELRQRIDASAGSLALQYPITESLHQGVT